MPEQSIEERFKEITDFLDRNIDKAVALSTLCIETGKGGGSLGEIACFGLGEHFEDIAGQFRDTLGMVHVLKGRVVNKEASEEPTTGAEA